MFAYGLTEKRIQKHLSFLWEFTLSREVFAARILTTAASCPLIWESKSLWKTFFPCLRKQILAKKVFSLICKTKSSREKLFFHWFLKSCWRKFVFEWVYFYESNRIILDASYTKNTRNHDGKQKIWLFHQFFLFSEHAKSILLKMFMRLVFDVIRN